MKCVFDTNVLVSALLLEASKPRQAVNKVLAEGKLLLSSDTLAELYAVLSRQRLRRYLRKEDLRRFLTALTREAEWSEIDVRIEACRDPSDNKFLELAVNGGATHIITGDADLLALHPFEDIQILNPDAFLKS